ncbi:hypothetical protein PPL_05427 [Heterostelium album PN500]|uniref:Uncharacterized protein n=1 Tax=Heterostelium pallidum (strain ATCC 26659 / Pp 5 / PN500) TaxID=670386 RepID=D3BA52_HETP5|nr:hypothetical protein PPL_05427 [Heterostelium album PN500]EFA81439.1 hypothetical protein PPL_05427 [Heterostelium album PN500]|eukprot:XP_020433557.1 hypothetical protein PPL_05427 [Heterostelium album PN500]
MSKKVTFIRNLVRVQPEPWFVTKRGGLQEVFKVHPEEADQEMGENDNENDDEVEVDDQEEVEEDEDEDEDNPNQLEAEQDDDFDEDLYEDKVAYDESHQNEKMQLDRHMKQSRQLFLRKRWVQRIKWGQFLTYTVDNYETLRESNINRILAINQDQPNQTFYYDTIKLSSIAREDAMDRLVMYKIERKNKWL